jgi:hypothetical protein
MKSAFKDRMREILNVLGDIGFLLAVFALFGWLVYSGEWNPIRWVREVFSILWFVAAFMSLLAFAVALDSRTKQDWEGGYRWALFATGCALVSLFMLCVTAWRCIRGLP